MRRLSVVVLSVCIAAPAFAGPKWDLTEDGESWMKLSFLGQVHYSHRDNAANEDDFYLRRGRIIVAGQVMDGVKFFVETDNDNAGRDGTEDVSTDIQDAFVDVRLFTVGESEHWLEAGLILLPFSFESKSSAASLLGVDYNAETIKLINTFVWRDYGAELHGDFGDRLAYRVGVFDGYDDERNAKNDEADLRYTGHIAVNLLGDVEAGWFLTQSRLGKKGNYISVGAGVDAQSEATLVEVVDADGLTTNMVPRDSDAWVVDVQSGMSIGEQMALTLNAAYYDWDNSAFEGHTVFVETGLLVADKVMPTFKWAQQDSDGDAATIDDYTVGLNYFLKGNNARAGLEYRWGDSDDWLLLGLQFLL